MKSTKMKRVLALLMAVVVTVTTFGQSGAVLAAGADNGSQEELRLYDAEERTDLDADEVATAENINVLLDSDYDVADVKDGISFYEDKVSVSYDAARSEFDITKTGTYDTYYIVEPVSGKKAYLIHRKVTVDEPEYQTESDSGKEADTEEEESEPVVGEPRKNEELPLSEGEIENENL